MISLGRLKPAIWLSAALPDGILIDLGFIQPGFADNYRSHLFTPFIIGEADNGAIEYTHSWLPMTSSISLG